MPSITTSVPPKTAEEWRVPSFRPAEIDALISGVDRYNPSNVALLEDYLHDQIQNGTYDLLANLAILKLYQFNPPLSSPHLLLSILLLSLASPPLPSSPDFHLSLSLALDRPPLALLPPIPSEEDEDEVDNVDYLGLVVPVLEEMEACLRGCRYREFWRVWREGGGEGGDLLRSRYLPTHPHLPSLLRSQISTSISISFSRIPLSLLAKWLDLAPASAELSAYVEGMTGWTLEGDMVKVEGNGDNDVKAGVVRENVELSQLTKLIAAAAH